MAAVRRPCIDGKAFQSASSRLVLATAQARITTAIASTAMTTRYPESSEETLPPYPKAIVAPSAVMTDTPDSDDGSSMLFSPCTVMLSAPEATATSSGT